MKAFFILILLAGLGVGGFYGYQYLEKEGKLPWGDNSAKGENGEGDEPADKLKAAPAGKGEDKLEPRVAANAESEADPIAAMYPLPKFQSVEELTSNWTNIPPRVFPRSVVTKEPVKLEIAPGASSNLPEGKEMTAVGMENGLIVLALDSTSTARAKVPATATSIVDQIVESYGIYQKTHIDRVMKQRESEKNRRASAVTSGGPTETENPAVAVQPVKTPTSDPRFKPMVDSINAEETEEIRMKNVQSWRWGGKTKAGGQEYDYGLITYSVDTLFGTMDTEAMALIKNGKVHKWIYTGSGDEVP